MQNPHPSLGNGQHIGVSALVLAAALMSVEMFETPEAGPTAFPSSIPMAETEKEQAKLIKLFLDVLRTIRI